MAWILPAGEISEIVVSGFMLACLVADGIILLAGDGVTGWGEGGWNVLLLVSGALAVAGGGPLTTSVLSLVDRNNTRSQSTQQAGEVLRGGALIGALERGAIYGSMVAGWPEGLAIVLAIKASPGTPSCAVRTSRHPLRRRRWQSGSSSARSPVCSGRSPARACCCRAS